MCFVGYGMDELKSRARSESSSEVSAIRLPYRLLRTLLLRATR